MSKYSGHDRSSRQDIPDCSCYDVRKRIGPVEIDTSLRELVSDMVPGAEIRALLKYTRRNKKVPQSSGQIQIQRIG